MLIWVFGFPTVGIIFLFLKRKKLQDPVFMSKYMVFYQGLKQERFYWEFMNTLRKILLICVNVFIPTTNLIFKASAGLILLVFFLRLQIFLKPYKREAYEIIEQRELYASIITIYSSFLFQLDDISSFAKLFLLVLIILINIWFWSSWITVFYAFCSPHKLYFVKALRLLKILSGMRKVDFERNSLYHSTQHT